MEFQTDPSIASTYKCFDSHEFTVILVALKPNWVLRLQIWLTWPLI